MTTLAALAAKDALVMGCDSLGSVTRNLVDPVSLLEYFDQNNELKIRLDEDGKPFLKDFWAIHGKAQFVPYNHMTHVDKLYSLAPLEMGVMATGISSIGSSTIKNIINQFKSHDTAFKSKKPSNYTVKSVANRLLKFFRRFYETEYSDMWKPSLELMIGGYDKQKHVPTVFRIHVDENKIKDCLNDFGIAFGGQMTEIQRIVFGTDNYNFYLLIERTNELLNKYKEELTNFLRQNGHDIELPSPSEDIFLLKGWSLQEFEANWGDFSERNAIECVKFFIDVMVKSQQFSNRMPTVGGDIHIAIITKTEGFKQLQ